MNITGFGSTRRLFKLAQLPSSLDGLPQLRDFDPSDWRATPRGQPRRVAKGIPGLLTLGVGEVARRAGGALGRAARSAGPTAAGGLRRAREHVSRHAPAYAGGAAAGTLGAAGYAAHKQGLLPSLGGGSAAETPAAVEPGQAEAAGKALDGWWGRNKEWATPTAYGAAGIGAAALLYHLLRDRQERPRRRAYLA